MSSAEGTASPTSMKLVVSDLASAEAFYRSICNFRPCRHLQFTLARRSFSEAILREAQGSGSLTLMAYDDRRTDAGPGRVVLTFSTDDLDAFAKRLVGAGGSVIAKPRALRLGQWHARIGEFADLDGNLLQVLQTLHEGDRET